MALRSGISKKLSAPLEISPNAAVSFVLDNSGQTETASFRAASLTTQNVAALARHTLEKHANAEVSSSATLSHCGSPNNSAPSPTAMTIG